MKEMGTVSISYDYEYISYTCSNCGKFLGTYMREGNDILDDIDGWNYCPYCGSKL